MGIYHIWNVSTFTRKLLWQEKYSLGNSEGVNIHLSIAIYSRHLKTILSSRQEETYRRNRMFRVNFVVKLLLLCQGKQLEEYLSI